jgi:dihydropteroate synthase-like protein
MESTTNPRRLLLVTGHDAMSELKLLDWGAIFSLYDVTIVEAPISTASFLTHELLEQSLESYSPEEYDVVLISGLIPWDASNKKSKFSGKIKKGPKTLAGLVEILKKVPLEALSPTIAADTVYCGDIQTKLDDILQQRRETAIWSIPVNAFRLSVQFPDLIFCPELPPIILAEVVDAPKLPLSEIIQKAQHYIASGAQIIDIGGVANEDNSEKLREIVKTIKTEMRCPVSIDSGNYKEIKAAVEAGADMVLSASLDNYHHLLDLPKSLPIVIIPVNVKNGEAPRNPKEAIAGLMQLGKIFSEHGFQKLLLDPITRVPINPGLAMTIETLSLLQNGIASLPESDDDGTPLAKPQLFMGLGNVTEMVDADSPGINALLAILGAELGVTALLTTEFSKKCRHSIQELAKSVRLAYFAQQSHSAPLNLGIDAFRLKTKSGYPHYVPFNEPVVNVGTENTVASMDPNGFFRIYIDEPEWLIKVTHFTNDMQTLKATKTFIGSSSEPLYKAIIAAGLVSRLDHAAYLGKELYKAELALKYGTPYLQE